MHQRLSLLICSNDQAYLFAWMHHCLLSFELECGEGTKVGGGQSTIFVFIQILNGKQWDDGDDGGLWPKHLSLTLIPFPLTTACSEGAVNTIPREH